MNSTPIAYSTLTPSLVVHNAAAAIAFYQTAFGALELYRLIDPESGKVGHAELSIGGSVIMLADEYPAFNKAPTSLGGTPVKLSLEVENVDVAIQRAVEAGATVLRPPSDEFYGHRTGSVRDPFGHEWILSHEVEKIAPAEMQRRWKALGRK